MGTSDQERLMEQEILPTESMVDTALESSNPTKTTHTQTRRKLDVVLGEGYNYMNEVEE